MSKITKRIGKCALYIPQKIIKFCSRIKTPWTRAGERESYIRQNKLGFASAILLFPIHLICIIIGGIIGFNIGLIETLLCCSID
ncbi:hypothetical protein QKU48_gp0912 [Fadolivirus algeromassiliense]|jgi:hypothetical protein|uniref:Uncharacterized protein n=1 Tax=Fadolivirus FV1/VV64 TaxID=3070911 RepID=A0A7D3UTK9_9VIRU|nr:hypothetical protein QKU48_gp0912 [Fadolivirus algeromassiliense]QKF94370.1 hypothetical protein Fadolivirus_1_912 [Fadolivirus FV1/VV64]